MTESAPSVNPYRIETIENSSTQPEEATADVIFPTEELSHPSQERIDHIEGELNYLSNQEKQLLTDLIQHPAAYRLIEALREERHRLNGERELLSGSQDNAEDNTMENKSVSDESNGEAVVHSEPELTEDTQEEKSEKRRTIDANAPQFVKSVAYALEAAQNKGEETDTIRTVGGKQAAQRLDERFGVTLHVKPDAELAEVQNLDLVYDPKDLNNRISAEMMFGHGDRLAEMKFNPGIMKIVAASRPLQKVLPHEAVTVQSQGQEADETTLPDASVSATEEKQTVVTDHDFTTSQELTAAASITPEDVTSSTHETQNVETPPVETVKTEPDPAPVEPAAQAVPENTAASQHAEVDKEKLLQDQSKNAFLDFLSGDAKIGNGGEETKSAVRKLMEENIMTPDSNWKYPDNEYRKVHVIADMVEFLVSKNPGKNLGEIYAGLNDKQKDILVRAFTTTSSQDYIDNVMEDYRDYIYNAF